MKSLIWKELRENLKWAPLPGLVILLVFLIEKPAEPMFDTTDAYFLCLIAVVFGAALGFVQIFFEGHGDKRSLLLHRPLSPSHIFVAKAIAGLGLYILALGVPFLCLESWLATPGHMPTPFHWQTSLPWLADILSGVVYYFAGILVAQRDVRWLGSRCLPLAGAFFCSCLVWTLTEFWQALLAIAVVGSFMCVAAWGSFVGGGASAAQSRLGSTGLALTTLAGLLIVSTFGKQLIGEWFSSEIIYTCNVERQGRVLMAPFKDGIGRIGPWLDADGQEATDLKGQVSDSSTMAPWTVMEMPLYQSYRNSGRFYVEFVNDSKPGQERWLYDQTEHLLLGYDKFYHQFLGSFGPNGFTPPEAQPKQSFHGELRHRRYRWGAMRHDFLVFADGVYRVDFVRRTIRLFFTPAADETVAFADWWRDGLDNNKKFAIISTDRSFHFLTETGTLAVTLPRAHDTQKQGYTVVLGLLENPERYFAWYRALPFQPSLGPEEYKSLVFHLHEFDATGRELASRDDRLPYAMASYAKVLFGLATPMTEAATLVGASQYLRAEARSRGNTDKPVLLDYLNNTRHWIPGTSRCEGNPSGLIPSYLVLILLAAVASALGCFFLGRRYALSRACCLGWAGAGILFGWVGLALMAVLHDWPALIVCPKCRKLRVVTRDLCEHCGARHAAPASDDTEVFDSGAAVPHAVLAANS
jgi:hypothetical protein